MGDLDDFFFYVFVNYVCVVDKSGGSGVNFLIIMVMRVDELCVRDNEENRLGNRMLFEDFFDFLSEWVILEKNVDKIENGV